MSENMPNNEDILQLAISAAKRNEKDNARMMLMQIYERDKRNESALMWLAKVSRDNSERATWLKRILVLNPDNKAAKKALERIEYKKAAVANRTLVVYGGIAAAMLFIVVVVILVAVVL